MILPSSGLEWMPLNRDAVCVEYRCDDKASCSEVGVIGVSPGRKITEKLPVDVLFITPVSSDGIDGDEHDSDFVSRNNGDPIKTNNIEFCICIKKRGVKNLRQTCC